jgi:hypothetical protein
MASQRLVAVVFGKIGGLSDCGAYAALHAFQDDGVDVRVIALSAEASEGPFDGVNVDVKDEAEKARVRDTFKQIPVTSIDVFDDGAQSQLEAALDGVEAVVSACGNRQPFKSRHLALSAQKVTRAMIAKRVNRLVQLSSFGIGESHLPTSFIMKFWNCLLATVIRSGRRDLYAMESVVSSSELDYLLVRPVGVDPEAQGIGSWVALTEATSEQHDLSVSKSDVGKFMLQEALAPTLHTTAVTLCQPAGTKTSNMAARDEHHEN